jgi:cytochrome c
MVPRTLWRRTAARNVMPAAFVRSPWTEKPRRMDSMEVNKGIAAILVAGILFFLTGLIGDSLVHERLPEKPALAIAAAPAAGGGGEAKPAGPAPIEPLLASANAQDGNQYAHRVCVACHTFDKGGKPGVGPNLYGVVAAPHDHEEGFNYSPALQKFKGQPWTFDALNQWLYKPSAYAPGTRMSFAGITSDKQRADVIAYLRSLSDNPVPLPSPQEANAPATAAPSSGGAGTGAAQPKAPEGAAKPAGAPGSGPAAGGSAAAPAAAPKQ